MQVFLFLFSFLFFFTNSLLVGSRKGYNCQVTFSVFKRQLPAIKTTLKLGQSPIDQRLNENILPPCDMVANKAARLILNTNNLGSSIA